MIDEILDLYIDYQTLYELFGDERYGDKAFGYEAEFYKITEWSYDVLQDRDVKKYKRIKVKG